MTIHLKIRTYESSSKCDAWIISTDGAALSGLLHGYMLIEQAEKIAEHFEKLGMKVEREHSPFIVERDSMDRPRDMLF